MAQQKNVFIFVFGFLFCLTAASSIALGQQKSDQKKIKRGEYLVTAAGGCNDCHTPSKMGPNGPEKDITRLLSGHPQEMTMPPAPSLPPGPWMATVSATMTAWAGPWGVSFTRNLTPDKETGLGDWTEQNFIETLRTGRQLGKGRQILPPMPYEVIRNMTDDDLKSIFAYLRSIPPIKNKVPDPIAPSQGQPMEEHK
jgi:cytochrome c553